MTKIRKFNVVTTEALVRRAEIRDAIDINAIGTTKGLKKHQKAWNNYKSFATHKSRTHRFPVVDPYPIGTVLSLRATDGGFKNLTRLYCVVGYSERLDGKAAYDTIQTGYMFDYDLTRTAANPARYSKSVRCKLPAHRVHDTSTLYDVVHKPKVSEALILSPTNYYLVPPATTPAPTPAPVVTPTTPAASVESHTEALVVISKPTAANILKKLKEQEGRIGSLIGPMVAVRDNVIALKQSQEEMRKEFTATLQKLSERLASQQKLIEQRDDLIQRLLRKRGYEYAIHVADDASTVR